MPEAPARIYMQPDGIEVWTYDGEDIGMSGKLTIGDTWRVGATDKATYPYEVLIVVVNRRE
jgi:hypothetical protein